MEQDLPDFLTYLEDEGSAWIHSQRDILRPGAAALAGKHRDRLVEYFRSETLDAARYRLVDKIENPGFYDELTRQGLEIPLDFSKMDGITFIDTIAISRATLPRLDLTRLLFHECVHVAQYKFLGSEKFVSQYVQGWAKNGFDYHAIPLERQAYELERRFARAEIFSVENAVAEPGNRRQDSGMR